MNTPLLDPVLVEPLLREFGSGKEILAIGGDDEPAVMAILAAEGAGRWTTFQPSQAPLGLVVALPRVPPMKFAAESLRALPGFALSLSITQQDPMLWERAESGDAIRFSDYIDTARINVSDDFESYWQLCNKKMRNNIRWRRNRLDRNGVGTRLEVLSDPQDIAGGVDDHARIESAGWKAEQGTAIHRFNPQGRFYKEIMQAFSRKGEARIYRYWIDDQLAASDLCVHRNGVLVVLKIAYDETLRAHGPSVLMREEEIRDIFRSGRFRAIEFYGRVHDWHTKWNVEVRTLYHVTCFRWSPLWTLRALLRRPKRA